MARHVWEVQRTPIPVPDGFDTHGDYQNPLWMRWVPPQLTHTGSAFLVQE